MTINVEFWEDNSGTSEKMHYLRKIKVGEAWQTPGCGKTIMKSNLTDFYTMECLRDGVG